MALSLHLAYLSVELNLEMCPPWRIVGLGLRWLTIRPSPCILVEPTSNANTCTEAKIPTALNRLMAERISFGIAHRLSTIRNVNKILVLNSRAILE